MRARFEAHNAELVAAQRKPPSPWADLRALIVENQPRPAPPVEARTPDLLEPAVEEVRARDPWLVRTSAELEAERAKAQQLADSLVVDSVRYWKIAPGHWRPDPDSLARAARVALEQLRRG